MIERLCKGCGNPFKAYNTIQNLCYNCQQLKTHSKPFKQRKPIPTRSKRVDFYEVWRDTIAKPYLDKNFGIGCAKCGVLPDKKDDGSYYRHHVDHIKTRGSRADLKMVLKNVRYLCFDCHRLVTDGKLK